MEEFNSTMLIFDEQGQRRVKPFNFWPHSFKFHLMDTQLIYRSQLKFNNKIITSIFPIINQPLKDNIELSNFTKSRNFSQDSINEMLDYLKIKHSTKDKKKNILILQSFFEKSKFDNELITTFLSYIIYKNVLENNKEFVPKKTMEILNFNLKKIQSFLKDLQKN